MSNFDWNSYVSFVCKLWSCPKKYSNTVALAGLTGELGELASAVVGEVSDDYNQTVTKELGDFLYYVTICFYLNGLKAEDITPTETTVVDSTDKPKEGLLLELLIAVGEYCEMVKKNITYTERKFSDEQVSNGLKQVVDVLAKLSNVYSLSLADVALANQDKLTKRVNNNTLLTSVGRKD